MPNINVSAIATELKSHVEKNKKIISTAIENAVRTPLSPYSRQITKVKGEYPQIHSIISHVVQGFEPVWNELGETQFRGKMLRNYHQKVNYKITPALVYGSYVGFLRAEGKKPQEQPISKYIIDKELIPKVKDDVQILSMSGEYDAAKLKEFGYSVQGLEANINALKSNEDNPCFKIPTAVLSDANILAEVEKFEKNLPKKLKTKGKCPWVFMSEEMAAAYESAFEKEYNKLSLGNQDSMKTKYGKRKVVGLPYLADDIMFTTTKENIAELIDVNNPGEITDIEKQIYDVFVIMEFHIGNDFFINELVAVSDASGSVRGLGNADLMKLYYPKEATTNKF